MGSVDQRIERAITEGEEILIGQLGDPPNEEAWADLAGMVIGDLAEDYQAAVAALRQLVRLKDGPRDDVYRAAKDAAWDTARDIVGVQ